jgi:hypothetical protein
VIFIIQQVFAEHQAQPFITLWGGFNRTRENARFVLNS